MIMNGKELTVHGTFKAAKTIVVTVDDSGIVSHTPQQVLDYVQSGYDVVLYINDALIYPTSVESSSVFFSTIDDEGFAHVWELCSNGLFYKERQYATQEWVDGKIGDISSDLVSMVKSVNSVTPDEDGNVEIPTGITKTLLWENASPTSSFSEQIIAFNVNQYQEIEVEFVTKPAQPYYLVRASASVKPGYGGVVFFHDIATTVHSRKFSNTKNTAIDFTGTYVGTSPNTSANNYLIPYRIYGIKGVTTL